MEIYNYNLYNKIFIIGKIQGGFTNLYQRIRNESACESERSKFYESIKAMAKPSNKKTTKLRRLNDKLNNSLIIATGDYGFDFTNRNELQKVFNKINDLLIEIDSHLILIRGNHDDPSLFNDKEINLSNIKAVSDYSVLLTSNENILCVGGAVSIDRTWRKSKEDYINRFNTATQNKLYWENEMPFYDEEALQNIINSNIDINFVVTHSAPNFTEPTKKEGLIEWVECDETLLKDLEEERNVHDKIYSFLIDNNVTLKGWYYSHYHKFNFVTSNECIPFMSMDDSSAFHNIYSVIENTSDLASAFKYKKINPRQNYFGNFGNARPVLGRADVPRNLIDEIARPHNAFLERFNNDFQQYEEEPLEDDNGEGLEVAMADVENFDPFERQETAEVQANVGNVING